MSLILLIRSLASKRYIYIVAVIFLLSEIMSTYFCCVLKGLVYVAIIALLGCQPSFYIKCTKSNIHSSCDIKSVSNTKCIFLIYSYILQSLRLPYLIYLRVLCDGYYKKTQL